MIKRNTPLWRLPEKDRTQRYLEDPRWEKAKELAYKCRYSECIKLTNKIMKDHGKG